MKTSVWVFRETVVAVHDSLLREFGGLSGIRDVGMFDSALARPEQLLVSGKPELSDLAAAYAFGLVRNHPFLDGNKRIGLATAVIFVELNGQKFAATEVDAVIQTLALAAGELDEAGHAAWLKQNSRRARRLGR